jgi:hypothetical protein
MDILTRLMPTMLISEWKYRQCMKFEKSSGETKAGCLPRPPAAFSPQKQTTTAMERTWGLIRVS